MIYRRRVRGARLDGRSGALSAACECGTGPRSGETRDRSELRAKDPVPDLRRDAEALLVVLVVVRQVVGLHLAQVLRQAVVVQRVVHHVVHDVCAGCELVRSGSNTRALLTHAERAGDDAVGHGQRKDGVRQAREGPLEHKEEQRRHDKAQAECACQYEGRESS